jgi:hypothetical protein
MPEPDPISLEGAVQPAGSGWSVSRLTAVHSERVFPKLQVGVLRRSYR